MRMHKDISHEDMKTERYRRALLLADAVLLLMRDFLPQDRECYRRIWEHLVHVAWETNTTIITVPPEPSLTGTPWELPGPKLKIVTE